MTKTKTKERSKKQGVQPFYTQTTAQKKCLFAHTHLQSGDRRTTDKGRKNMNFVQSNQTKYSTRISE